MTSKYIVWILGVALVIVLGAFVWLWKSQDETAFVPGTANESANLKQRETPVTSGTEKDKSADSANLDDIANNIGSDASDDLSAIDDEATAEANLVEEGGTSVNDLGKTYDESEY